MLLETYRCLLRHSTTACKTPKKRFTDNLFSANFFAEHENRFAMESRKVAEKEFHDSIRMVTDDAHVADTRWTP